MSLLALFAAVAGVATASSSAATSGVSAPAVAEGEIEVLDAVFDLGDPTLTALVRGGGICGAPGHRVSSFDFGSVSTAPEERRAVRVFRTADDGGPYFRFRVRGFAPSRTGPGSAFLPSVVGSGPECEFVAVAFSPATVGAHTDVLEVVQRGADGSYGSVVASVALAGAGIRSAPAPRLPEGTLDGLLVRLSGSSLRTMRAQNWCGNSPKAKYLGGGESTLEILRPAAGPITVGAEADRRFVSLFGMDVNTSDRAYTWGAAVPLVVDGTRRSILLNATPLNRPNTCRNTAQPRPFTSVLPVTAWIGRSYVGRACMKLSQSGPGRPWTLLAAFGRCTLRG